MFKNSQVICLEKWLYSKLIHVIVSTWIFKIGTAIIVSFPANVIVAILKKTEGLEFNDQFHLLKLGDK